MLPPTRPHAHTPNPTQNRFETFGSLKESLPGKSDQLNPHGYAFGEDLKSAERAAQRPSSACAVRFDIAKSSRANDSQHSGGTGVGEREGPSTLTATKTSSRGGGSGGGGRHAGTTLPLPPPQPPQPPLPLLVDGLVSAMCRCVCDFSDNSSWWGAVVICRGLFRLLTCLVSFCKRGCRIRALLRTRAGEFGSVLSNVSTLYMGCWKFFERGDMRRWKVEEQGEMGREMKRERSCDIGRESGYTHTHRDTHTNAHTFTIHGRTHTENDSGM